VTNYTLRLQQGTSGLGDYDTIIRFKTVSVENIVESAVASMLAADLELTGAAGITDPNQGAYPNSQLKNISCAEFVFAVIVLVMRRFGIYNWISFDNQVTNAYVLAGAQYVTGIGDITMRLPTWMVEAFAGLQLLDRRVSRTLRFVTCPVVVSFGMYTTTGYDYSNPQSLYNTMQALYPNAVIDDWGFKNPQLDGLPDYVDPAQSITSFTQGDDIPNALTLFGDISSNLQGNMSTSVCTNRVHKSSTFMHFTYMLNAEVQEDKKMQGRHRKERFIHEKKKREDGSFELIKITPQSLIYGATVSEIRCRFKFSAEQITWILTKILPVTFIAPSDYAVLYAEKVSAPTMVGTTNQFEMIFLKAAVTQAHPISGMGDEQSLGDKTRVEMGLGGGVLSTLGGFLDGLIGI